MKSAPWIIIIILLGIIFFLRECTPVPECPECPEVDTIEVVRFDTIRYEVVHYEPKIVFKDTGSTRYIFKTYTDTIAVLKDFFARNYYSDTLVNDSMAFVLIQDTVTQNQIANRRKTVRIFPATVYKTTIVTRQADPRRKLYVGLGVGRSVESFGLAPSLLYISKKETAYSLSFDVLNKDLYFTMYFKLSFKK
jgi:hypothetical protein